MNARHVATATLGLTLVLGACGGGSSAPKASGDATARPSTSAVTVTTTASAAVQTDDLDADLQSVDREIDGARQDVNQANDTSPERADD